MHDKFSGNVGVAIGGMPDTYARIKPEEPGLIDQLTVIAGRVNELGNQIDSLADRVAGPTPRDVNVAGSLAGVSAQGNLPACVRSISDLLSRVEREINRIAGAL